MTTIRKVLAVRGGLLELHRSLLSGLKGVTKRLVPSIEILSIGAQGVQHQFSMSFLVYAFESQVNPDGAENRQSKTQHTQSYPQNDHCAPLHNEPVGSQRPGDSGQQSYPHA